jgi:hypothetical protein
MVHKLSAKCARPWDCNNIFCGGHILTLRSNATLATVLRKKKKKKVQRTFSDKKKKKITLVGFGTGTISIESY